MKKRVKKLTLSGLNVVAALLIVAIMSRCGAVKLGTGPLNMQAPNAPISASGSFNPNQNNINGSAVIYHLSPGSYEAFLSGFQGPTNISGIFLRVTSASGAQVLYTPLISNSGNQTYQFSTTDGTQFALAQIYQTSPPSPLNDATLTNTGY